jgi:hypothetical protein
MSIITINDENFSQFVDEGRGNGMCGTLPRKTAYGASSAAQRTTIDLISPDEIPARIADKNRNKSWLYNVWERNGKWVLNQNPLSFCWCFSAVEALMLIRAVQNLPFKRLSPSSVACPINNWVNAGGYIENALQYLVQHGVSSVEYVPEMTCDQRDFKRGWREDQANYRVTGWDDLEPRNPWQVITSLLLDEPVVVGLNWWEHALCYGFVIDKYPNLPANRWDRYTIGVLQSYGPDYGNHGWFELEGNRWLPDQAYRVSQGGLLLSV